MSEDDAIILPGDRKLYRSDLSRCRCPGCRHCGAGCNERIFEMREWKVRQDKDSEWSYDYAVRCRVCMPPEDARKDREGATVRTKDVTLAEVDAVTGKVRILMVRKGSK